MRKITAGFFLSLDGVMEAPETWHFPYFNDEMGAVVGGQMAAADTMLLGRRTYDEFAAHWSTQGSDVPFADQINGTPKYVVSTTLTSADWKNSTLISENVADEVRRLKEQPGKDISVTGSATLVRFLLEEGLLDELSLLLHPIVVGRGRRLFAEEFPERKLALQSATPLSTGVVHLTYHPA